MDEDLKTLLIDSIICEYCSAEYKARHDCIKNEIDNAELYLDGNDDFDNELSQIESKSAENERRYFV